MAGDESYITVEVIFHRSTKQAILVSQLEDNTTKAWIPRSTLSYVCDGLVDSWDRGDQVEIELVEWIAKKKELV